VAAIAEGATADGWVEFWQNVGSPQTSGTYTIEFAWYVSWSVWLISVCDPMYGDSHAFGSITIGANAEDLTTASYLHDGDATNSLYNQGTSCPGFVEGGGGSSGVALQYHISFSGYLLNSNTHMFYSWLHVSTAAVGFVLGGADAETEVTWNTPSASTLGSMSYSS
jgi:hypothetical protein